MYTAVHFCTEKRQTKPLVILAMPQESRPTPPLPPRSYFAKSCTETKVVPAKRDK